MCPYKLDHKDLIIKMLASTVQFSSYGRSHTPPHPTLDSHRSGLLGPALTGFRVIRLQSPSPELEEQVT